MIHRIDCKIFGRHIIKEEEQMSSRHKNGIISHENKIYSIRHTYMLSRLAKFKNTHNTKQWEAPQFPYTAGFIIDTTMLENSVVLSQTKETHAV